VRSGGAGAEENERLISFFIVKIVVSMVCYQIFKIVLKVTKVDEINFR
jgi:hypothetical protein